MRFLLPIGCCLLLASCSTPARKHMTLPTPGGGTYEYEALVPSFRPAAVEGRVTPGFRYDPAQFPFGMNQNSFWWDLLSSTNGSNWTVIRTNISGIPEVPANKPREFFRVTGHL